MSLPHRARPLPPSVVTFRRREARQAPPQVIYGQDLTAPAAEPEPTYAAELLWTAACMALSLLLPMLLVGALYGPAAVWWPLRDALAELAGLVL